MKKIVIGSLVATTLLGTIAPTTAVLANERLDSVEKSTEVYTDFHLDEDLKNKVDPYISIENNKFVLEEEGISFLTPDEIEVVEHYLFKNNQMLVEIVNSNTQPLVQEGNEFIQTSNSPVNNSGIALMSVSSGGVSLKYTWWGLQIQFSHNAVKELDSYVLGLGGITGALAKDTIASFLAKKGLTVASKWLGPIGLAGGVVVWGMSKIDKGNGVNLNCILYVPATLTAR